MLEARLQHQFFESADLLNQAAEQLTRPLSVAAQLAVACVTGGGRLLCAGAGVAHNDALAVSELLQHQFEQERPGLAALPLQRSVGSLQGQDALVRQLQVLGHPGDVLLWLDPVAGNTGAPLLRAARELDIAVIALCAEGTDAASAVKAALTDTDVLLRLSASRLPRRLETQRVALHALCDAIDAQLLGLEA
ncbi:MAG: SIS domain-containing protein [Inhella sp.]|jgi:D-sedoheptulose 7-phosphate isomerase|uniref:SIS domain-containing protein n=1 Tax=Inhella sp. TaxID=1921806 RepID=UPI0022CCC6B0|nr:SIS domain-containing protein [Inhella sp.]MCZ8235228.1 SIS domain-containing protein [Inhella sp.]